MFNKVVPLPFVFVALVVVGEEGLRLIRRRLRSKRQRTAEGQNKGTNAIAQYDGLESLVSFSACLIAANRAVETEQPQPYISDSLAAGLCGQEAMEARRARSRAGRTSEQADQDQLPRPIPRLIMRTKFFDDVVTAVTWRGEGGKAARPECHAPLLAAVRAVPRPCLQVVLLGSGLDARPWRLALPAGVRWFEVDRRDVLAAKTSRLQALGAQTATATAASAPADEDRMASPGGQTSHPEEQEAAGSAAVTGGWRHPLRAAEWRCVAVDLQRRGWSWGLRAAGLDPGCPVLWVLEGFLYYLEEEDVRAVLKEAASISAPGSILAASVIRASQVDAPEGSIGAASPAPPRVAPSAVVELAAATTAEANGGAVMRGGAVSSPAADGAGRGSARVTGSYNLHSEFKWKCRERIPEFLGNCGWRALTSLSWLDAAHSYGFPTGDAAASTVHFVTAALDS